MFSNKPNYLKLRTNLRLCINRLKLLEKKKTELALKARREIADYISAGKDDRARIRVEHIIREDYLVEAMEIIEMLCDLLLARFGLIEKMAELDPGIEEAIATIIWVAPRLYGDIQELREVAQQLTIKYGKEFAEMCRRNGFENVNEKVIHKMSLAAPPKILVENYMVEIARTYKVPFEPDPLVMMGQPPEASNLIDLGVDALAPTSSSSRTGVGPSAAELKAFEAGQVTPSGAKGQLPPPSVSSGAGYGQFPYNMGGIGGSGKGDYGPGGGASGGLYDNSYNSSGGLGTMGAGGYGSGSNSSGGGGGSGMYAGSGAMGAGPVNAASGSYGNNFGYGNGISGSNPLSPGSEFHGSDRGVITSSVSSSVPYNGDSRTARGTEADYSNALIGGVPVLPSEGQFPPPVPPGYMPPGGVLPSLSQPAYPPVAAPRDVPGNARAPLNPQMSWINDDCLPSLPPYDQVVSSPDLYPGAVTGGGNVAGGQMPPGGGGMSTVGFPEIPALPEVPGLPSVPSNSLGGASVGGDDVDFDDLTRRFEELKRRK